MFKRISNPDIAILGGVLAGVAYRFGIPPWLVRLIFISSLLWTLFLSVAIYFILWLVLPSEYISQEEFDVGVGCHPDIEEKTKDNSN